MSTPAGNKVKSLKAALEMAKGHIAVLEEERQVFVQKEEYLDSLIDRVHAALQRPLVVAEPRRLSWWWRK